MIPKDIQREHILAALADIDLNGVPKRRDSSRYILVYKCKPYPPKLVVSLAVKQLSHSELDPQEFGGGRETNVFLQNLGFIVTTKKEFKAGDPVQTEM